MADVEEVIEMVECGLLPKSRRADRSERKRELEARMKHYKVPGFSIALVNQKEVAWAKGYGVCEAGGNEPVTPETIFQAASISKPVTAMVALRLVDRGVLDLDADVNDVLRSWKVPKSRLTKPQADGSCRAVTLRGLLSHSAGMSVRGYPGYTTGEALPSRVQILNGEAPANSKPVRVIARPGSKFSYSGGGYMVVQQIIEDVTGQSLARLAQEWIFKPLEMKRSTFAPLLPQDAGSPVATAHREGMPVHGKWHMYPEQSAAGLWTTPTDLARLVVELIKSYKAEANRVLRAETIQKMMTSQLSGTGLGFGNGLGFFIVTQDGETSFGHPGWNEGYRSLLGGMLESGFGFAWMTNGAKGNHLGFEVTQVLSKVSGWRW